LSNKALPLSLGVSFCGVGSGQPTKGCFIDPIRIGRWACKQDDATWNGHHHPVMGVCVHCHPTLHFVSLYRDLLLLVIIIWARQKNKMAVTTRDNSACFHVAPSDRRQYRPPAAGSDDDDDDDADRHGIVCKYAGHKVIGMSRSSAPCTDESGAGQGQNGPGRGGRPDRFERLIHLGDNAHNRFRVTRPAPQPIIGKPAVAGMDRALEERIGLDPLQNNRGQRTPSSSIAFHDKSSSWIVMQRASADASHMSLQARMSTVTADWTRP
jgi:hypothetical protein